MTPKITLLVLDGGTWDIFGPHILDHMPHFSRLLEKSSKGILHSTQPPMTPVACAALQTGVNPQKNGILHYQRFDNISKEHKILDSRNVQVPTIHDLLSMKGQKVISVNLPVTFPVKKTSGAMISGILTPSSQAEYVFPPSLKKEIEGHFGPFPFSLGNEVANGKSLESQVRSCIDIMKTRFSVSRHLAKKRGWDVFIHHIKTTDILFHSFYEYLDPVNPNFSQDTFEKILPFFQELDAQVGLFLEETKTPYTIVASDHGFQASKQKVALNVWLNQQGYLYIKDSKKKQGARTVLSLVGKVLRSLPFSHYIFSSKRVRTLAKKSHIAINWGDTTAFMGEGGYEANIYLYSGADREELIKKLKAVKHPQTNESIIKTIITDKQRYGTTDPRLPNLILVPHDGYSFSQRLHGDIFVKKESFYSQGIHHSHGILAISGKGFSAKLDAKMTDILPTILDLLGHKKYPHMDGKSLKST